MRGPRARLFCLWGQVSCHPAHRACCVAGCCCF
jgi:hypothetical protein